MARRPGAHLVAKEFSGLQGTVNYIYPADTELIIVAGLQLNSSEARSKAVQHGLRVPKDGTARFLTKPKKHMTETLLYIYTVSS